MFVVIYAIYVVVVAVVVVVVSSVSFVQWNTGMEYQHLVLIPFYYFLCPVSWFEERRITFKKNCEIHVPTEIHSTLRVEQLMNNFSTKTTIVAIYN